MRILRITGIIAAAVLSAYAALRIAAPSGEPVRFVIKPGMTGEEIAGSLRDEGLICSRQSFLTLLRVTGTGNRIRAGTYELKKNTLGIGILNKIVSGKTVMLKLVVPEGFTACEIASLVDILKPGSKDEFMKAVNDEKLEGFLFPETYLISPDLGVRSIIDCMLRQFGKALTADMIRTAKEKYKFTEKDIVTLASMIEKEARDKNERNLISAVFHNRLRKRYYLESCATVMYALGIHKGNLTYKDLQVSSPYNTYRHLGLPPGPICNPGLDSLKAAVYPADSDVMFFVARGDGTHDFSKDYMHHLDIQKEKRHNGMD